MLLVASCNPLSEAPPSKTTISPAGNDADCSAACARGRELKCVFAEPTPDGESCEAVCHNSETSGYASMNPACMAQAADCAAADDCANQ